jgi:hypothetical protein
MKYAEQVVKTAELAREFDTEESMTEEFIYALHYPTAIKGISICSGDAVTIIGEQEVRYNGQNYEQYIYTIDGYTPKNGKPFIALKANIIALF